jgi:glycosyltransferase involved in cell wall biosynthesis
MNILFLTSRFPFPPIGGDKIRPYWFIKELSKRHRIHLLSFAKDSELDYVDEDIKNRIKISIVNHSHLASCLKTAANILRDEPLQVSYYYYETMRRKVEAIIKEEKIDLVFAHLIRMAKYVKGLHNIKKVIDYTDSFGLLYTRSYKARKGLFRLIDYTEKKRADKFEKECLSGFERTIISSDIDRKWIENKDAPGRIDIITMGMELAAADKIERSKASSSNIAFIGNMRSFSNRYAVTRFAKKIFPIVKKRIKGARLFVIGASPPKFLKRFPGDKNIYITARVDDVDAYLSECALGVAPMVSCSGVQDKILKYMSLKLPTVATRIALGDLKAAPGRDIVIADSDEDFAGEIISLLENRARREEIGENGYKYVSANHNWGNIVEKLDNLLSACPPERSHNA